MKKLLAAVIVGLLLVILASPVNIVNAQNSVTLDHTCGLFWGDSIFAETQVTFYIRFNNNFPENITGFSNGFRIYSPDGATWNTLTARCMSPICSTLFDGALSVDYFSVTGSGADTIGFWGVSLFAPGMQPGFSEVVLGITIGPIPPESSDLTICLDSSFFPPSGAWKWGSNTMYYWPSWSGGHCFQVYHVPGCEDMDADGVPDMADNCPEVYNPDQADFDGDCVGDVCQTCCLIRGDVNHSGAIDISDIVYLVTYFFYGGTGPPCLDEADVNSSGTVDISDLTYLASYMFSHGPPPIPCQ